MSDRIKERIKQLRQSAKNERARGADFESQARVFADSCRKLATANDAEADELEALLRRPAP